MTEYVNLLLRATTIADVTRLPVSQRVPFSQATRTRIPLSLILPELIGIIRMTKANTQTDFEAK